MLTQLKEKALAGFELSADFIEGCADRQVGFATFCLQSSLDNAKKLRHSKNLNDILNTEKEFLKGIQDQLTSLAKANTEALKSLGGSTKDYVASIIKPSEGASATSAAIEPDKKIVRKAV
jgi:predicted lactoylglutathione lyase